jgi:cathepsin H
MNGLVLIVISACLVCAQADRTEFQAYLQRYNKIYSAEEESVRFAIYEENVRTINTINSENRGWTAGINMFTDMSWEEFRDSHLFDPQECSATVGNHKMSNIVTKEADPTKDWRDAGVVTPVKNQGNCGSCWTFSTTGALESAHAIKTGDLLSLSEQQLVDCADAFENDGCNGGLPSHAFNYIHYNGGIQGEDTYPYTAKDGRCVYDSTKVIATVQSEVNITEGKENELFDAVTNVGPVAIAFQVASDFSHYTSGVYISSICKSGAMDVNHAVLAVGYGTDDDTQYWTVKNSWGASWGEAGYFRILRNKNMCGIATCASYPVV